MRKGQVFTADFIASVTIFSFFILFFGITWNSSIDVLLQNQDTLEERMNNRFSLLQTEGYPENWDSSSVSVLGVYNDKFLSLDKLSRLRSIEKSKIKRLLKAQEYKLDLTFLNGSQVTYQGSNMSYSSSKIPENKSVYLKQSITVIEEYGKRARLRYLVWKE